MAQQNTTPKAPYAQPKLMTYGGFAQLTAAGSGATAEGMAMALLMRRA